MFSLSQSTIVTVKLCTNDYYTTSATAFARANIAAHMPAFLA